MATRGKTRGRAALTLGGLAAVGGAAVFLLRRRADGDGDGSSPVRHVATVVVPPEEVRAAWAGDGRLPGLPARVAPSEGEPEGAGGAPVRREVPGVEGLRLGVLLSPAPDGRGTEIRAVAEGPQARSMSGQLREDLRRIKSVLEAGEWVTVEGQPSGRGPGEERITRKIGGLLRKGGMG